MKIQDTAERRQVTVLHCDIVNSTVVVDSLDPEDVLSLMEATLANWIAIIEEFRGTFVGYTGDGFQAYFGYPYAHEDAAVDALSAAIQVSRMFAEQKDRIQKELECRIGISTGQVVIGRSSAQQFGRTYLAFGSTPCLAARLEQAANPGRILIDAATRRLAEGRFVFKEIGPIPAKGFKSDVEAYEVVRKRRPGPRFDASQLSPYVGRHRELETLCNRWQLATQGAGQVIVLRGEPGIGKSRLVFELEKSLGADIARSYQFQCSSLSTSTPLHPWIHWVQRFANIDPQDATGTVLAKLQETLGSKLGFTDEVVKSFAVIMGVGPANGAETDETAPQKLLKALQSALVDNLINAARDAPIFVLVEDVHWMDASTQGVIELLVERLAGEKIFLVMTSRPENVPSFDLPHVTSLSLTKLDNQAVSELVATLVADGSRAVDENALMSTIEKCEGNPFFVEQFSKHYLEHMSPLSIIADKGADESDVPVLLQGSLLERIDTAGRGKGIAQLASVIGPEFDREILIKLSKERAEDVQQILDQLTEMNILSRIEIAGRISYAFRHALLRDAVYSSLLHTARSAVHLNVAAILAADRKTYSAEVIARHFESGGDRDLAFIYWLEAGQHALESGASEEAVNLLASAVNIAQDLDETPARLHDLTNLYLAYGHALNATAGAVADPIRHFRKAEKLAVRLDDPEFILEALDWQFGVLFNAGEVIACMEPARKMKDLGLSTDNRKAIASGCQGLGMAHFMQGKFAVAGEDLEQGLKAAGNHVSGKHCFPSMSLTYLAWTLFIQGSTDRAASCAEQAIASARHESPHAIATALSNCAYVYQCMGAVDEVYACANELLEQAKKHGELIYLKRGTMTRSWADCMSGREHSSIHAVQEHIDLLLAAGEEIEVTYHLGVLADLQIRQQRYADAVASLDKALQFADKNQEKFYLSELYRLKAIATQHDPETRSAGDDTDYLAMAHETARSQKARAWLDRLTVKSDETVG